MPRSGLQPMLGEVLPTCDARVRARRRAVVGAAVWFAAPWIPAGQPPAFGSIEHVFLSLPLVTMPFALALLTGLVPSAARHGYALARRVEPAAAATLLASFFVAQGPAAAALTAGWALTAVAIAFTGLRARPSGASLVAAHVFLPIGAAWLLLSRLGVAPPNFGPLTAMLAAVHFHFSGFALQILFAATDLPWPRARALHRVVAFVAIVAIPLIAAGNLADVPALKFLGVASMVLATTALAGLSIALAFATPSAFPRRLLALSAGSLFVAMALAGIYGVGEVVGTGWIGIARMAAWHGLVNAFGFTLCGLLAHLYRRRAA